MDAVTVGLGPGMKKPEADGSALHHIGTTDTAQVMSWLRPLVALLPDGSAKSQSSKTYPRAAALGWQVSKWGGRGPLLTLVLLDSPKHQTKTHPEIFCVHAWPHLPCQWAALARGHISRG